MPADAVDVYTIRAESLERVGMRCLEKEREARPQSVAELGEMLDACADVAPWTSSDARRWWARQGMRLRLLRTGIGAVNYWYQLVSSVFSKF